MRVENSATLPENYREYRRIDLQKDKKLMLLVNLLALVIMAVLAVLGHLILPIQNLFSAPDRFTYFLRMAVLIGGMIAYMILHEAVHGIFMRKYGKGIKPTFGFTGMYAFAASRAYFNRRSYLIIGLSPIVIWGVVLLILNLVLPTEWFWPIYIIQAANLSGAAGDLYVSKLIFSLPKDFLVKDDGVAMTFYVPKDSV